MFIAESLFHNITSVQCMYCINGDRKDGCTWLMLYAYMYTHTYAYIHARMYVCVYIIISISISSEILRGCDHDDYVKMLCIQECIEFKVNCVFTTVCIHVYDVF